MAIRRIIGISCLAVPRFYIEFTYPPAWITTWPARSETDHWRRTLAVHQLHHDGILFDAVDLRDVRVVERCERACLALEAHQTVGIVGERLWQDLQRHVAVEPRIARAIHLAIPPSPNFPMTRYAPS